MHPHATHSPWAERVSRLLHQLAERPLVLLAVLLAANALARPYGNIEHDARLYSVQVLNHVENGIYDNDLFFRYGSQDRFSLFSSLMAPLVRLLGLDLAFFLAYLVGNTVLIVGMMLVVRRICPDPVVATLALLYLMVVQLNYGGKSILSVNEYFLTARLLGVGLVMLALHEVLRQRFGRALAFLVPALLVHPLMAVGGWLIWAGALAWEKLGTRTTVVLVGCCTLAGVAVLATPTVAGRIFGDMDDSWRDAVRAATSFNFAPEWEVQDWVNVAVCALGLAAGIARTRGSEPQRARFYAVTLAVGVAAVIGTFVAGWLPYALLLQGQPYRALWILKVLQVPLGFLLIQQLWLRGSLLPRVAALLLTAYFVTTTGMALEWLLPILIWPVAALLYRGLESEPRRPDWLTHSVIAAVVVGCTAWGLYLEYLILSGRDFFLAHFDTFRFVRVALEKAGALT